MQFVYDSGVTEEALEESLRERIADARELEAHDEGVASALLLSLQDETERVRREVKQQESELDVLRER